MAWKEWAENNPDELDLWKTANQEARKDIVRYKQNQSQYTTVGFALYGGLIALSKNSTVALRLELALLALLLAVVGVVIVTSLHRATERARKNGKRALRRLAPLLSNATDEMASSGHRENLFVTTALCVAMVMGGAVTMLATDGITLLSAPVVTEVQLPYRMRDTLFWTFSTIPQTLAASFALVLVVLTPQINTFNRLVHQRMDSLHAHWGRKGRPITEPQRERLNYLFNQGDAAGLFAHTSGLNRECALAVNVKIVVAKKISHAA